MSDFNPKRRRFLSATAATAGLAAAEFAFSGRAHAALAKGPALPVLAPIKQIDAGVLNIGYYETGPVDGPVVILLHGFPYDIHSYVDVAPVLASHGCRVIVPYLRGHGATRFLKKETPRSGQQAALGADTIALMDALKIESAVLAGYDWGGRAACVVAALWPERCSGLVSVNSYLIQDIAKAATPISPAVESGLWYQYYFQTERGRAGLEANRRALARTLWLRNSPTWRFDDATLDRSAASFENDDYVEVVIHSYRHRLGLASGDPAYAVLERRLAEQPVINVPTITLDGESDGVVPATDGKASAARFTARRAHRTVPNVGHNLPQEAPIAFADAVTDLVREQR